MAPAGVAYGDGAIWVTNQNEDSVVRVDPENLGRPYPMVTLKAGSAPIGITTSGQDVWVAESLAGAVARIDPDTMTVTKVVPLVRGNPAQVSFGEGFVWVTATDDDSVTRIDPSTSQGTTIPDVGDGPTGVAVGDGAAWIADSLDGSVSKVDPATATVVERFSLGPVLSPDGVATTPGSVWISVHDR